MILADFGAEVLKVEPPGGDRFRHLPAAPMWLRGKQQIELDIETSRSQFDDLAAGADVLVCNWRPATRERLGLDFATLHAAHPHLTVCFITPFGNDGPMANVPGYEHVVAAYAGRMGLFAGIVDRPGPVFSALQVGIHACTQSATAGILAALFSSEGRVGRLVETSLLQGMLPYEQGPMIGAQFPDRFPALATLQPTSHKPPMPSLFYHPAQAGDGRWMQFGNLLPHLFDNFLINTDLIDIVADPDFDHKQLFLPPEKHEAFRERMLKRIQDKSAAEWMDIFVADGGVVATAYQTTQEALQDPDIVANGHVIQREEGGVQLGPLGRFTATPAQPGNVVEDGAKRAAEWRADPRSAPDEPASSNLPLSGVRVVELATIIAAPMGAALLADMGADVIKVEQIGGDPYRGMGGGIGAARVNPGKRSISVNLKSPEGQALVLELLKGADVVIHNYRPGVPEKLGIGYDRVLQINPNVIYLQSNGYGPDGPGALRPSTHPIPGAAMGGVMFHMGERLPAELQDIEGLRTWTARLMRANEVNPDPNTALVIASCAVLGLLARQRTGQGQQVFVDMFGANAYANHDDFLNYPGKAPRAVADDRLLGLSPTYRLYSCADETWVFLALTTEAERSLFADTLDQAKMDVPRLEEQDLTSFFSRHPAQFWADLFIPAGVGCVQADGPLPSDFWLNDEQAIGLTQTVEHPDWGAYERHGPLVTFDGKTHTLKGPPLGGQQSEELAQSLGYDAASLLESGVLWSETNRG